MLEQLLKKESENGDVSSDDELTRKAKLDARYARYGDVTPFEFSEILELVNEE